MLIYIRVVTQCNSFASIRLLTILFALLLGLSIQFELIVLVQLLHVLVESLGCKLALSAFLFFLLCGDLLVPQALLFSLHLEFSYPLVVGLLRFPIMVQIELRTLQHLIEVS